MSTTMPSAGATTPGAFLALGALGAAVGATLAPDDDATSATTDVTNDVRLAMALGVVAGVTTGLRPGALLRALIGADDAGRLVRAVHDLAPTRDPAAVVERLAVLREMEGEPDAAARLTSLAYHVRVAYAGAFAAQEDAQ